MVIHASLLVAVQPQPAPAVTAIEPLAASADPRFEDVGEIATVHGVPAWVTVNVCPAIVIVPLRDVVEALAVTL
jgi:hypothetical protein